MALDKNAKIYVAGHHGLVGSAIWNNLLQRGYANLVGRSHKELDLTDQVAVKKFFDEEQPEAVVLAAAFVGGIMANMLYRADFIMMNMKIQCNVISEAYAHGVKKLLFLGSTCIYPKNAPQPMKEDCLLTSPLEYTNDGPNDNFHLENSHVMPAMMRKVYLAKLIHDGAWDKIAIDLNKRPVEGITGEGLTNTNLTNLSNNSCNSCNSCSEEKSDSCSSQDNPCHPSDPCSSKREEVLRVLAKYGIYDNRVVLWGTGKPLREFLWSEDMADASVHVLLNVNFSDIIGIEKYSSVHFGASTDGAVDRNHSAGRGGYIPSLGEIRNCHINVGTGKELTIRELSELVVKAVGFEGEVAFDASKPDGTMRKLIDVSKLHSLGWTHKVEIEDGVQKLFDWYKASLNA